MSSIDDDMQKTDFSKISKILNLKFEENDDFIKKNFVRDDELCSLQRFRERIQKKIDEIECTPSKEAATFDEIRKIYSSIGELPQILRSADKKISKDRMNMTVIQHQPKDFGSSLTNKTLFLSNSKISNSSSLSTLCETKTSTEIFEDYLENKRKINELLENKLIINNDYHNKAQKLYQFIKNLEKLNPETSGGGDKCKNAFTELEEEIMKNISNAINEYCFILENQNIYKTDTIVENNCYDDLNKLIEIVMDLIQSLDR